MWLLETMVNILLFTYIGVLIWLYTCDGEQRERTKD